MFGTIIKDAYHEHEAFDIAMALDELCSPTDSYGWASAGIYCYWDYATQDILYIGLTVDLAQRFRQHNGMLHTTDTGSKTKKIKTYFKSNKKLGFSIFVQSPLSQPVTSKNIYKYFGFDSLEIGLQDFSDETAKVDLKILEGILLEAYRRFNGSLPLWNKISGSLVGRNRATDGNHEIVDLFKSHVNSPLIARYSLREIANNAEFEGLESYLHAVRMYMLSVGCTFNEALNIMASFDIINRREQLRELDYFSKSLNI